MFRKCQRFLINSIAHITPQFCGQIGAQPASEQGARSGEDRDRQHGNSLFDNIFHVARLHADIDHIRRKPGDEQAARHIQQHGKDRKNT